MEGKRQLKNHSFCYPSPLGSPLLKDDETGAQYIYAKTEEEYNAQPFKQLGPIGFGGNGTVHKVEYMREPKVLVAAKTFLFNHLDEKNNEHKRRTFKRETSILQCVAHKNIIRLFYPLMGPTQAMIMVNYCPRGYIKPGGLTDAEVRTYFINILDAVRYIHKSRIIHRDIKLTNILLDKEEALLSDFGHSKRLPRDDDFTSGICGTEEYIAPEVYHLKSGQVYEGFKADSYAVGVFLWCLLRRRDVPDDLSQKGLLWQVLTEDRRYNTMDPVLRDSARRLLDKSPWSRMSAIDLYDCLCRRRYIKEEPFSFRL